MLSMLSFCRRASFLQLFPKFVQSTQSPTFIEKFLTICFCSVNFKKYKCFIKIPFLVDKTHVCQLTIDTKPSSLSLFHQLADVSKSLLHLLRSLARTVAVVKSSLHSSKSSLTLSIHFFLCRPLLLLPRM